MAVRQIKIIKIPNKNVNFFADNIDPVLVEHSKKYDDSLINSGKVLKINTYQMTQTKKITEIIFKDIESFLSTCDDLSKDPLLSKFRLETAKYQAENNIIETQTREFNYDFEA